MNRALFLDRDGVINEDYGYVHRIEDFHFRQGIFEVCRAAQNLGFLIVVVTNQSGIGRGLYTQAEYADLTAYMCEQFCREAISMAGVYSCPYHPEFGVGHYKQDSFSRKPRPGMFIRAASDLNINLQQSIMVGDKQSDRLAGEAAGIRFYIDSNRANWAELCHACLEK